MVHLLLVVTLMNFLSLSSSSSLCLSNGRDLFPYGRRVCFLGTGVTDSNLSLEAGLIMNRENGFFHTLDPTDILCSRYKGTGLAGEHIWVFPYSDNWSRIKGLNPHVICDHDGDEWMCRLYLDLVWIPYRFMFLFIIPILVCIILLISDCLHNR